MVASVIEVFLDSDKVGADVLFLTQSCMRVPVNGLLEFYEDMVAVLMGLDLFLAKGSSVEDLL